MDPRIVDRLWCPVCRRGLAMPSHPGTVASPGTGRSLRCAAGHSFDLARHGYVDLATGVTHPGDTPEMIAARGSVLQAGHFDFVTAAVGDALHRYPDGLIVDVGAGTGHHLAALLDRRPDRLGLAIDVSKAALRRAARAHPRLAAVRADVWRGLPVADGAAEVLVNIFAPRAGREFARVLAPGGRLVVVTPTADHLRELALALRVDPAKEQRLTAALAPWFVMDNERELRAVLRLGAEHARALAAMGPSAHHTAPTVEPAGTAVREVTAAVRVSVWRHGED